MNSTTTDLLQIFFANECGTDGRIPDCHGCEHNIKNVGCTNDNNPMNKMEVSR